MKNTENLEKIESSKKAFIFFGTGLVILIALIFFYSDNKNESDLQDSSIQSSILNSKTSGVIPIYYAISENDSIDIEARFYIDDEVEPFAVDSEFPYEVNLDTTNLSNGEHKVKIKVFTGDTPKKLLTESSLLTIDVSN